MSNNEKEYTTLRVSKETSSLVDDLKLWVRHRDNQKYDNNDALYIFISQFIDEFRDDVINKTKK